MRGKAMNFFLKKNDKEIDSASSNIKIQDNISTMRKQLWKWLVLWYNNLCWVI